LKPHGCSDYFRDSTNVTQPLKKTIGRRDEIKRRKKHGNKDKMKETNEQINIGIKVKEISKK
jgi:hypothetical protein